VLGGVSNRRGQSNPIALVLIFGLVIAATTVLLVVGGVAITDTQDQLNMESAEKAMTQLDSQASLVALGQSRSQTVSLGSTGSNSYQVSASAGSMTVTYTDSSDRSEIQLMSAEMGAIVYEGDDGSHVAYQGGGVWRSGENGGATMVSPPEFHYEDGTLTLPLVTVSNDATLDGNAIIKQGTTSRAYPNETLKNPLKGGAITITVQSQYHEGWYRYLNSRTQGTVEHDPGNQTVEMTLTVPIEAKFESSVATVAEDGITGGEDAFEQPYEEGVTAPVPDSRIDARIADCESGGCTELSSDVKNENLGAGTYNASGSVSFQEVAYDTSAGDINIVVDGDVTFKKGHDISGDGEVTFFVGGDVTTQGSAEVNTGGNASDLLVMVHSAGDSFTSSNGGPQFTGLIYAPGSEFVINGGGNTVNVKGSIIVNTADGGNGDVEYANDNNRELDFTTASAITYLHVSENRITVTD